MEPAEAPVSISATVVPPRAVRFNFDNTYARLDARFHARVAPMPVAAPQLIKINAQLADKLGLDPEALATSEGVQILAGNRVPEGGEPLGQAYAGHQFGSFVPQLGDGRANLMGEVLGRDGVRYDIQLKGSGRTPFSRGGDGRAALGPVLREYLVSEAMAALGVPTTRALAAVTTGETVLREAALPGAVLTRVAASHLRVGTFQYFAAREDTEALRILADYAIARHDPQAASAEQPYRAFLDGVITRQARLIAQWMSFGFIHGVMNTDNSSISGETIDYGPCAFMEAYDPSAVFSFIDRQGRYAFANQPRIALWNLTRLAESLLPLLAERAGDGSVADRAGDAAERADQSALASATEALSAFAPQFEAAYTEAFRRKLGLATPQPEDAALIQDLLERMASSRADFTRTFRLLGDAVLAQGNDAAVRTLFADPAVFDTWAARWHQRLHLEKISAEDRAASMRRANPVFIPRNHLVEAVIQAAVQRRDFQPFETLLDLITHPHADRPGFESYAAPARPEERVEHTFCGT